MDRCFCVVFIASTGVITFLRLSFIMRASPLLMAKDRVGRGVLLELPKRRFMTVIVALLYDCWHSSPLSIGT